MRHGHRPRLLSLCASLAATGCAVVYDFSDYEVGAGGATGSATSSSGFSVGGAGGDAPCTPCGERCFDLQTTSEHCGSCDRSCLGGPCAGGLCQPLVLDQADRHYKHITLRDEKLFWTVAREGVALKGEIRTVDIAGQEPATVFLESQVDPDFIRASPDRIYYTSFFDGGVFEATTIEKTLTVGRANVFGLAFDATYVYFNVTVAAGEVRRIPLDGGDFETVSPGQDSAFWVEVDGSEIYWSTWGTTDDNGTIVKHELDVPVDTLLFAGLRPSGITLDADFLYWVSLDRSVQRVSRRGGGETQVVAEPTEGEGIGQGGLVLVDGERVYWVTDKLRSASLGGGDVTVLYDDKPIWGITQDATALYFTTGTDGRVLKLAK